MLLLPLAFFSFLFYGGYGLFERVYRFQYVFFQRFFQRTVEPAFRWTESICLWLMTALLLSLGWFVTLAWALLLERLFRLLRFLGRLLLLLALIFAFC